MFRRLLIAVTTSLLLAATPSFAGRADLDQLRGQIMRLNIHLQAEALRSPEVLEAQRIAGEAYTLMHTQRGEVLTRLYQTQEYRDLRLALYHTQRRLVGVREEIPARIQKIMETATDALAVRVRITQLEASALNADEQFVVLRDEANAQNAAYRQALRDALESVQKNPELVALTDQLASMMESVTGMRSAVRTASAGN